MAVPIYTVKNLDSYWERTAYWLDHERLDVPRE